MPLSRAAIVRILPAMRIAALVLPCFLIATTHAAAQNATAIPACVQVRTESRYVPYGYNHIVSLKNGCSKAATCVVSTNVNPQPASAEIAAGATVEVLTFAGSPARDFEAQVCCKLH